MLTWKHRHKRGFFFSLSLSLSLSLCRLLSLFLYCLLFTFKKTDHSIVFNQSHANSIIPIKIKLRFLIVNKFHLNINILLFRVKWWNAIRFHIILIFTIHNSHSVSIIHIKEGMRQKKMKKIKFTNHIIYP